MWTGRVTVAEVNLDAVSANVRALKAWLGSGVEIMAVVKANAYGLGARQVGATALDSGASWLAVAIVDEGVQLRQAGIRQPILVMGYAAPAEAATAVAHDLTLTVNSIELAHALDNIAFQCRVSTPVHLKLDSGLTRFGRPADEIDDLALAIKDMHNLYIEGLYTHFADADAADLGFVEVQNQRFRTAQQGLADLGVRPTLLHAANSAATLAHPSSHYNMVRCGLLLHGLYPSAAVHAASQIVLTPDLIMRSQVARLMQIATGETVGYGRSFIAHRPTIVATVPIGYADGYPRNLGDKAAMLIGGKRAPLIGRISMDQCAADVTDIDDVLEGDEVVIVGPQGNEYIGLDELAALGDTISYEMLTGLAPRVPRLYYRGGTLVNATTLLGREDLSLSESLPQPTPRGQIPFKRGTTPLHRWDNNNEPS